MNAQFKILFTRKSYLTRRHKTVNCIIERELNWATPGTNPRHACLQSTPLCQQAQNQDRKPAPCNTSLPPAGKALLCLFLGEEIAQFLVIYQC